MSLAEFMGDFDAFTQSWWPFVITFLVTIISSIRLYVGGSSCTCNTRLDGKTAIITGGASGLGLATARELAKRGAKIILAIRNGEKGRDAAKLIKEQVRDAVVTVKLLDVSDFTCIKTFVAELKGEYEKIDILINNAGIINQPFKKGADGFELTYATNYLGPFLLTHLLLPLLNESENGRVINISAAAHFNAKLDVDQINSDAFYDEKVSYAESKLALTSFTKHMAAILKDTKITFNAVCPGLVRTATYWQSSKIASSWIIWPWVWLFLKSPKQGCQSIVYAAVEPGLATVSGCYLKECEKEEPADLVKDADFGKALYKKTCKLVHIKVDKLLAGLKKEAPKTAEGDAQTDVV